MNQLKVNDNTSYAITTPSDLPSEKSVVDWDSEKRIAACSSLDYLQFLLKIFAFDSINRRHRGCRTQFS